MSDAVSLVREPSPQGLAELALVGSVAGCLDQPFTSVPLGPILQPFWSGTRNLQNRWLAELTHVNERLSETAAGFEMVALELFLTELLARVWATNWTILDQMQGQSDARHLMQNTLRGLEPVRREVLLLMVKNWRGTSTEMISRLDRFRRRCERWTDLLIAGPASVHGVWEFAVEPDRARDFGQESWSRPGQEANPASLLVSAGLRVMFGTPWPAGCCRHDSFAVLMTAVLSTLPPTAFHEDGALKPARDWFPN